MTAPPNRRWFRFGLRTMFVLVTLAAIPLSWLGWHVRWLHQRQVALEWLNEHSLPNTTVLNRATQRSELPWLLKVLGEKPVEERVIAAHASEKADLAEYRQHADHVKKLFPECYLVNMDASDAR